MKRKTIFIFYILVCLKSFGQIREVDSILIRKICNQVQPGKPIVYVALVEPSFMVEDFKRTLRNKEIIGIDQSNKSQSLILSRSEKKYLLRQMKIKHVWPDSIFKNSKRLQSNQVFEYMAEKRVIEVSNNNSSDTVLKFPVVFNFLKPISFRNGIYYLVSYYTLCGLGCGSKEIAFYKKEGNDWVKWLIISKGVF
ncbi:MAG: hypothetical protein HUU47_04305 [Bacteroidetes bacterium]|nr:hypothetical protein [Bacteroidota bacterium]